MDGSHGGGANEAQVVFFPRVATTTMLRVTCRTEAGNPRSEASRACVRAQVEPNVDNSMYKELKRIRDGGVELEIKKPSGSANTQHQQKLERLVLADPKSNDRKQIGNIAEWE